MSELHERNRRTLQFLVLCAVALGAGLVILGFLPGYEVYRDVNDCSERSWDHLRSTLLMGHGHSTHDRASECAQSYVFVESRRVSENPLGLLVLLLGLLAPGAAVWRRPRLVTALLWSVTVTSVVVGYFAFFFSLNFEGMFSSSRTVELWPAQLFSNLLLSLFVLLVAIVPLTCGVLACINADAKVAMEDRKS